MNLKKIEFFGFKSFADKLGAEFDDGVTAIVGPNGCGKSNVVDAIRWVLGEQAPKALRASKMTDIIFGGTEKRKSLSYCEVSLYMDNSNNIFPKSPFEEVIISRKLYRSGQSEYLLNRETVRLADILDLIRDTGLGKDGYSIVGQGKIDEIMNTKPENRRSIFEDAAGILTYKKRKQETENKLARANDNIDKLKLIMDGYERQLGPLEKQSNDAKKYLTLRDRLRELEVSDYLYRVDNSESQKSKIRDKIEAFDLQIKNREDDVRRADEEYTDTMVRIGTIDQQISKLHDEQTRLAVAAESVRGKGNTLTERISNLIELRKQSEQRQVELEKQLEDKTAELADYVNHLGMFTEEKEDLNRDIAETDKKYLTLTDEIVGRERDIENTNRALLEAMESIAEIKADKGKLSAERESALQRIGELNDECNALKLMIEREEENKRKLEESVSKLEKQKNKLAKNKNDVAAEVSDLRARIDDKRLTQEELAGEVSALETKHRILSNNDTKISAKLLLKTIEGNPQYESRVEGMIASMIKVPREYEIAIDLALGSASQNVVVRDEEDAKVLIRLLRDRDLGRVTFLPMTSYGGKGLETYQKSILHEKGCIGVANELISYAPKYQSVMLGLLGKTVVFDNIDNAVAAARRNAYSVRIVTLDGDVLNTSGSISGGSNKRNSLLMQEREIKTTEEQIKSKRKEYSALQQEILQDREYLAELQAQLEEYEEDVKNAEVAYATEFERLDRISNKIETALEDLDNKSKMLEILNGKLEFIESNLLNIDKSVTDISGTKGNRDEADRTKAEFEEKKRLRDKYSKDLSDMRVRLAEVTSAITKVNENIVRVKRECEEVNEEINDCKARIKELNSRIGFAESNRADAVVSEDDKKKYAEATAKIEELNGLKITLNERITYLNDLKDAQSKEIMALNESKVRQEAALEKIDDMMVSARNHIEEEYGLADDEMNRYRLDDFDPSVSAGEITKLKREKTALGAVNLDAIEMFKEIGAEYSTKKVEYDDLVKAKEDFEKIIADLAKQMQEQFNTEFAKINENFQKIFVELFGGGSGKLVIEEPPEGGDMLEAGIEIYVQPPGKKLTSMTLMSGGEKALTAIAILFSILRLRPMPFVVLDEIEAALDESNVEIFAKYLKRFSDNTQFIVVTHRKPTMELADRLYGVTMQEKGVSTIVTVSLAEAIKHSTKDNA